MLINGTSVECDEMTGTKGLQTCSKELMLQDSVRYFTDFQPCLP